MFGQWSALMQAAAQQQQQQTGLAQAFGQNISHSAQIQGPPLSQMGLQQFLFNVHRPNPFTGREPLIQSGISSGPKARPKKVRDYSEHLRRKDDPILPLEERV